MKKFYINSFILVISVLLLLSGCNKDDVSVDADKLSNLMSYTEIVERKILQFKDKIDMVRVNPDLKMGNEVMDISTAEWHLEALTNYLYANAGFEFETILVNVDSVSVNLTGTNVDIITLQAAFDQIADILSEQYSAWGAGNIQLIVTDIYVKNQDEERVTFGLTSGFGISDSTYLNKIYNTPWYWGWELGTCDGSGYGVGKDAADIIMFQANVEVTVPTGASYYTNVSYFTTNGCEYQNPNQECYLFEDFQEYELIHACLSPEEIGWYKNNVHTLADMHKPPGKSIIYYLLYDATAYALCGQDFHDCWYMVHFLEVTYGIWHIKPPES
jgi:hypothetical protein